MGLILLDFDGTITQQDTLNALVHHAIAHRSSGSAACAADDAAGAAAAVPNSPELSAVWRGIVRDYAADHAAHVEAYAPPAHLRGTLAQELAFLESLRPVEERSVGRVSVSGLLAGLEGDQLERFGREAVLSSSSSSSSSGKDDHVGGDGDGEGIVRLRKGFGRFVERMGGEKGWDVGVVSVNWSGSFIKGVVESGWREPGHGQRGFELVVGERIVANGIRFPGGQIEGPKELGGEPLLTVGDKLRAMRTLRARMGEDKVVYFGDSTTDLACLVEADLGVVMADDEGKGKLLRTLNRVGLEVPHVSRCDDGSKLTWARDFEEVLQSRVMERVEP